MITWRGRFQSTMLSSLCVNGVIILELDDINNKNEYMTSADIIYIGTFHNGQCKRVDVKVNLAENKFSGTINGTQPVVFTITQLDKDIIRGTYECQSPHDRGEFVMQSNGSFPSKGQDACSIM